MMPWWVVAGLISFALEIKLKKIQYERYSNVKNIRTPI